MYRYTKTERDRIIETIVKGIFSALSIILSILFITVIIQLILRSL